MVVPSKEAYSESFIQAQKKGLEGTIFYYYGGSLPTHLEEHGELLSTRGLLFNKIKRKLRFTTFSLRELAFISSLKEKKIQVVFAQYGTTSNRIVNICKHLNIPLITHFHGYDASVNSVINSCKGYHEVFSYSTFVIAVSRSMKEKLIALGCPREKLVFNTYGPDDSFLGLKPKFAQPVFIGLGRFVEKKAPYYTILAFSKIVDKYPEAKLIIGGDGSLYEVCKNLVQYLKIEKNVLLPGVLSKQQFLDHMVNALAFVQHSITAIDGDMEGTPVAVLEASAAGLPVIATTHAGIPDVILDEETGLLVAEHDVEGMTKKMFLLLENNELAMQLGQNGKKRIQLHFSMARHLEVLNEVIKNTIKNE